MTWEEWIFVGTNIVQVPMMLPMFLQKGKPPIVSSLLLSARAAVCGVAYLSIGFTFAFVAMVLLTAAWAALSIQKHFEEGGIQDRADVL